MPAPLSPSTPDATTPDAAVPDPAAVHSRVIDWFDDAARDLPWRRPECGPWGVMVSEVMLQQTPVTRVLPRWEEWMRRWPTPADAAGAPVSEILTVWDRLGYPRRALRLQEAARAMVEQHDGEVPGTADELRALPGVGEYTAAAVACFAFSQPEVVVDTNIRRVHARVFSGQALPGKTYTAAQRRLAHEVMPPTEHDGGRAACAWNAASMELGALICTAKSPQCAICPVADLCAWVAAGSPPPTAEQQTRGQAWAGTDRQVRGAIMALLREAAGGPDREGQPADEDEPSRRGGRPSAGADGPEQPERPASGERLPATSMTRADLLQTVPLPGASDEQRLRCLESLLADGLAEERAGIVALPGALSTTGVPQLQE